MISSYSDYIRSYLLAAGLGSRSYGHRPIPGEHHFVAAYLLPRLFEIAPTVPDYINPDGTKGVLGDVVYYRDHRHHFSLEVKLDVIRLTKGEFNPGIVGANANEWPDVFLGVGKRGLVLMPWRAFRESYRNAVIQRDGKEAAGLFDRPIESGYGPQIRVDVLMSSVATQDLYLLSDLPSEQGANEARFRAALRKHAEPICEVFA